MLVLWGSFEDFWVAENARIQNFPRLKARIAAALHHVISILVNLYTEIQHGLGFGEETHLSL